MDAKLVSRLSDLMSEPYLLIIKAIGWVKVIELFPVLLCSGLSCFVCVCVCVCFLPVLPGMWDLSLLSRDGTHTPCHGSGES